MTNMTEERKGQIAYVLLKDKVGKEGIHLRPELKREIGDLSKRTGISAEELRVFASIFIDDLKDTALGTIE